MSQTQVAARSGADQMISAAVRGLIAQRRISATSVAVAVGVSRAALYKKMGGVSPWHAEEVDRLARFFDVSRDSLYEGRAEFVAEPTATLADARTRSSTDRASDYGSQIGRSRVPFRGPRRRLADLPGRHLSLVPAIYAQAPAA